MTKGEFEKLHHSDKCLYGPRKLLLTGFSPDGQSKFMTLLKMLNLSDLPVVWASENHSKECLKDLASLPGGYGHGENSALARAIIVSGITEKELHILMSGSRQAGMKRALWAALTPVSEKWRLDKLLAELEAERKALSKRR